MSRYPANIITKSPATPTGPNPITGRAPGVWRMEDVAYWLKQGVWPDASADGYWPYTSLLLSTTSLNGAQNNTFLDSSTNNFTITRNGNTTQGSFSPYGSYWSNYFDGSGDYLSLSSNAAFDCSTGDWTIEGWVNVATRTTNYPLFFGNNRGSFTTDALALTVSNSDSASYNDKFVFAWGSGGFTSPSAGSAYLLVANATNSVNTWYHFAVVRNGTSIKMYRNGTEVASATISSGATFNWGFNGVLVGGGNWDGANGYINGYISNLRLVKGTAVYTSNFTPPTAPLTAISGTSLLTCQSNRFIDNSSNAFAITVNGDTKVTPFSPFTLASVNAYSTTANGGSAYFDGSGDYVSYSQTVGRLGTGDWTLECWAYATATPPNYASLMNKNWTFSLTDGDFQWSIKHDDGYASFAYVNGSIVNVTTTIAPKVGAWTHYAVTRVGTTLRIYANGVLNTTATLPSSFSFGTNSSVAVYTGYNSRDNCYYTGYINGLRVLAGTALYTGSTYTVPTTPATAITNTSFLMNATNAGIYDATTINDMETVGNAQVSTVQSKFGGSSMYFDGSGDWLTTASNNTLSMGTGNFTAEMWVYPTSVTSYRILIDNSWDTATYAWQIFINAGTVSVYAANGAGANLNVDSTSTVSANVWTHIAVVKSGTTVTIYLNGTASGSGTMNTTFGRDAVNYVGAQAGTPYAYEGYIDDLRITKGVARYTSNFTPPTQAFPVY